MAHDADGTVAGARRRGEDSAHSGVDLTTARHSKGWRYYLRAIGPGLVTGATDDDPSGIASYAHAGAMQVLGLLWTSLVTFPLMGAVLGRRGFKTAPFLIIVVLISRDRTLMGQHTNGRVSTTMGWITVALKAGAALTTLINVWPSDPRLAPAIAGQFSASLTPTADSDWGEVDGPR